MLSSDLVMRKNFLKLLLKHFKDRKTGMVVGRPKADKNSKIYPLSKIIWDLHHLLCLKEPKGAEICAFRKIFNYFPKVSADEVFIEYRIKKAGYKIVYEPRASGYSKIPRSLLQFFRQRRRIFNGHLQIRKKYEFVASSMKCNLLLEIITRYLRKRLSLTTFFTLCILIFIEFFARIFASVDSMRKKYEIVWRRD